MGKSNIVDVSYNQRLTADKRVPIIFITYVAVIGGLVVFVARRTSFGEQVLRDGL